MARNILPNWLTSLWSRKPVSTEKPKSEGPSVQVAYIRTDALFKRYDITTDKIVDVTPQEFYDEVHQFMNLYGSFLKGQKDLWEKMMHQYQDLPEDLEDLDKDLWELNFFFKPKKRTNNRRRNDQERSEESRSNARRD